MTTRNGNPGPRGSLISQWWSHDGARIRVPAQAPSRRRRGCAPMPRAAPRRSHRPARGERRWGPAARLTGRGRCPLCQPLPGSACTAPNVAVASDLRVGQAARWYSLITPPRAFRRCTGAPSGTMVGSSWSGWPLMAGLARPVPVVMPGIGQAGQQGTVVVEVSAGPTGSLTPPVRIGSRRRAASSLAVSTTLSSRGPAISGNAVPFDRTCSWISSLIWCRGPAAPWDT